MRIVAASAAAISTIALAILMARALPACDSDTGCTDDYDCDGALVCKVSTGSCESLVCKVDTDCQGGLSCDDNTCH